MPRTTTRPTWLWTAALTLLLAGASAAQEITGTYDITPGPGWGRVRADGADLVLEAVVDGQARPAARGSATPQGGRWRLRAGAATGGVTGALGDLLGGGGGGAGAGGTEVEVSRLGTDCLRVVVRERGRVVVTERWSPREGAFAVTALPPERRAFSPYRTEGPNTVTVPWQVEPADARAEVEVRVVDRAGAEVLRRALGPQDAAGAFTWDGRQRDGRCVDARRSPYRVTFTARRAGEAVESAPVDVVAVPRLDAAWVVSRVDGGAATSANKVVAHDAKVELIAVVRAVVAGARPEEPGRTERVVYVGVDGLTSATLPQVGRIAVERWDDALWPALAPRWQEVRALGLHRPAYRATQNLRRATTNGQFTNVVSNGPDEGKWIGRDTLEYDHVDRPAGPTLEHQATPGTLRYRFDADLADPALALGERAPGTPGRADPRQTTATEARSGLLDGFSPDLGGAGVTIHRISRRGASPHPLLSHLEAYRGVPWLYGSLGQQVQEFVGYDCADLVFAAARRAGLTTKNQFTNADIMCKTYTKPVVATVRFEDGQALDLKTGSRADLSAARPGDVVFFDWDGDGKWDHTTVLWDLPAGEVDMTARLVWAGHGPLATDGFKLGTVGMLAREGARMIIRRF